MQNTLNKHNQEILAVLKCIFLKKIKSKQDKEKLDDMTKKLLNKYYFVKHNETIGIGVSILYINCDEIKKIENVDIDINKISTTIIKKQQSNIHFTGYGKVIDDNDDILTLTSTNKLNQWQIYKNKNLIFKRLTQNELLKMSFEAFLNN
jgi:hypothetical protein